MVDPMWEDWSRDGQFIKARDMCRFCPTVGRSATGRVKIFDHPDSLKNVHGCL